MQRALIVSTVILAAGCSSTPPVPPVFSESFITNITPQGNHFFTYSATLNMQQGSAPSRSPGRGRGSGKGRRPNGEMGGGPGGGMGSGAGEMAGGTPQKMRENPEVTAMERVETLIAESGYCARGWFVIEKTVDRGNVEIRGECRTASAAAG